jgi:diguanylate cyclase (GGDEF)-like protein
MRSSLVLLSFFATTLLLFYSYLFIKEPISLLYYALPLCMAALVWETAEVIAAWIICGAISALLLLFATPALSPSQILSQLMNFFLYLCACIFFADILKQRYLKRPVEEKRGEVPFPAKILESLTSFCKAINSQEDVEYIQEDVKKVMNEIIEVHGANCCMVFCKDGEDFKLRYSVGDTKEAEKIIEGNIGTEMKNFMIRTKQEVVIANVAEDPRYKSFSQRPLKSVVCVPIVLQGGIVGFLYTDFVDEEVRRERVEPLLLYGELFGILFSKEALLLRLRESVIFDGKTRLLTYKYFEHRLDEELSRARRWKKELALMLVYVEEEGKRAPLSEEHLRKVADVFRHNLRQIDLVARYDDNSFMVLLTEAKEELAYLTAERVKESILKDFEPQRMLVNIGMVRYQPQIYDKGGLLQKVCKVTEKARETGEAIIMD